jgi:superfamily II DNA or RNA helicase
MVDSVIKERNNDPGFRVNVSNEDNSKSLEIESPAISLLKFPFSLKKDQIDAVDAWIDNSFRGTILYSTGTGKTEIAFECARIRSTYPESFAANCIPASYGNSTRTGDISQPSIISHPPSCVPSSSIPLANAAETRSDSSDTLATSQQTNHSRNQYPSFNILFLVPRISLIDQTIKRLLSYGIPQEKIGAYFGERKEIKEIIISTYHSVARNHDIIRRSNMVIFDEVHLIKDTAKSFGKIFDIVVEDPARAILGLTATLDVSDFRNGSILAVLPPIKKYSIRKAVSDKRLANPVVIPIRVRLTEKEQKEYDISTTKIRNISTKFKRYDATSMTMLLKKGGFASGMAKAWFANVRKRKLLLSYAENKLSAAADIVTKKFPNEKIMVFSETVESISKLKEVLKSRAIDSNIIDARTRTSERQKILDEWGNTFNVLLSVHTLEIGYDVPHVGIEIILATTSNMNQVIQRIGRVIRKHEGKHIALIYVIYVSDTKDNNTFELVKSALKSDTSEEVQGTDVRTQRLRQLPMKKTMVRRNLSIGESKKDLSSPKEVEDKRVERAYNIIESSLKGLFIVEQEEENATRDLPGSDKIKKIYKIQSSHDKNKFYEVDLEDKSCTCADFRFRRIKCKHIIATEFVLP